MKQIEYEYAVNDASHHQTAPGQLKKEKNFNTHQTVSDVTYPANNPTPTPAAPSIRTETRGDGATRTFQYSGDGYADLEWFTDFKGQRSYIDYDASTNFPTSYRTISTNARGYRTWTDKSWYADAVVRITYPDAPGAPYVGFTYSDTTNPYYLTSRRDENGNITYYDLYANNRIWRIRYPDNSSELFAYDGFGQVTSHTMTSGGVETALYDGRGLKTLAYPPATGSDPDPWNHPTRYYYYTSGFNTDRLQRVQDPRGNSTWYEYNLRGQVTKVTHQDGTFTQSSYNLDGTLAWSADENHPLATATSQSTRYTYDEYRRVTAETNPLNQTTTNIYAPWSGIGALSHTTSAVYQVISPMGKTVHYDYDQNFRKAIVRQAPGTVDDAWTYYGYDAVGNLISVQDPRGNVSTFGYNERNRKTSATDPAPFDNQVTQWQYDAVGNKTRETRPDGAFRSWDYDTMNRLGHAYDWRTNDPPNANQTTTYSRTDPGRNVTQITDQKGASYTYIFDQLNRKITALYPLDAFSAQRSEGWHYDVAGNVDYYQNQAYEYKHAEYDTRNRAWHSYWNWSASNTVPDWFGSEITTQFDAGSRVTSIATKLFGTGNNETTLTYGYDDANRQLWEEQTVYGYPTRRVETPPDADGNRYYIYCPGLYLLSYDYTQRNQLKHIIDGDGHTPWVTYSYDASGNMSKRQNNFGGLNDSVNATYDQLNRPMMWENTGSNDAPFARSWYQYDSVSREVTRWRDEQSAKGERFNYEVTNQLSSAYYDASNVANGGAPSNWSNMVSYVYTPDKLNRASVTTNGAGANYTGTSQMNQYGNVAGQALSYDGNFNLAGYAGGSYSYDASNQLQTAARNGNGMQLVYDGLGRCLKRTINGAVKIYAYDNWKPLLEFDGNGAMTGYNVYGPGADELLFRYLPGSGHLRYHYDREGSVMFLLNDIGAGVEKYTYDAFGKPKITNWSGTPLGQSAYGNRFMFTGREYFPEFGLYDYRHRVYQPELGRFLQTDPAGFDAGDMNLFRYCADDPVDKTDPTGLIDMWTREKAFFGDSNMSFAEADAMIEGRDRIGESSRPAGVAIERANVPEQGEPTTVHKALKHFDIPGAIGKLGENVARYREQFPNYPDGGAVVAALEKAKEEGRIRPGDRSNFKKGNPMITRGDTVLIDANAKVVPRDVPSVLAHEGEHLADKRQDGRFNRERRAYNVQYGFGRVTGSTRPHVTDAEIRSFISED